MGQHDPGATQANALGLRGQGSHEHLRGRAHNARVAVVFTHPKAVITQGLTVAGQRERLANGVGLGTSGRGDRLIKYGKLWHAPSLPLFTPRRCLWGD